MPRKKLSVVMPSFNEERAIGLMIGEIRKHTKNYDTEILVIDGGWDRTAAIAVNLGATVIQQKPQGHGMALREGLHRATGDYIITADCDNTYPMEMIPYFMEALCKYDLVSGNRMSGNLRAMPFSNRIANKIFAFIVRRLYGINTHDVTTGMFGMTREVARTDWEGNYSLPAEIIIRGNKRGYLYTELPIAYRHRVGEVTLNRWKSGKAYLGCFLRWL